MPSNIIFSNIKQLSLEKKSIQKQLWWVHKYSSPDKAKLINQECGERGFLGFLISCAASKPYSKKTSLDLCESPLYMDCTCTWIVHGG